MAKAKSSKYSDSQQQRGRDKQLLINNGGTVMSSNPVQNSVIAYTQLTQNQSASGLKANSGIVTQRFINYSCKVLEF